MATASFRHGLSPGGPILQIRICPKARQWRSLCPCKRYPLWSSTPLLASVSLSPSSSSLGRAPNIVARAEANTEAESDGEAAGGPPQGSVLTAKPDDGGPLQALRRVTPIKAIKWTTMAALALTAFRALYRVFFNPSLWTYGSLFFVIWPIPTAVAIGAWSIFSALPLEYNKRKRSDVKERDQIFVVAGALTWLILVPLGLRHGYIEGWPLTLFIVYLYFFLVPAIIILRQYGDLGPRPEDKQWSSSPSWPTQIAFGVAVVGSHWLAAYEGPHLYFAWNWQWPSCIALFLLGFAYYLQYISWYFLAKYFDRLVKPTQLVIFGPYRFIRHPIYMSYILLFAGYCVALRAYKTLAFLILASLLYYDQRARIEEKKLEEAFGKEQHKVYRMQTKYKFFPFLY